MMHTDTLPYQQRTNPTFHGPTSAERVTVPSSRAGASPMPPVKLWKQDNLPAKKRGDVKGLYQTVGEGGSRKSSETPTQRS